MANAAVLLLLTAATCITALVSSEEVLVKLEGGSSANEGTVFIKYRGEWGVICDDDWDIRDGQVLCKQLGYKRVVRTTSYNYFRSPVRNLKVLLDDVMCAGSEKNVVDCRHRGWGISNCNGGEAAGVVCSKEMLTENATTAGESLPTGVDASASTGDASPATSAAPTSTTRRPQQLRTSPSLATRSGTTTTSPEAANRQLAPNASPPNAAAPAFRRPNVPSSAAAQVEAPASKLHESMTGLMMESQLRLHYGVKVAALKVIGGRFAHEGYVQLTLADGRVGVICADNWGMFEAMVACRHAGQTYARQATNADFFGGVSETKLFYEVDCDGHEMTMSDCAFREASAPGVRCSKPQSIAGVVCTKAALPDLVPNIGALLASAFIQEVPLQQLECAMEERCLSSSAYTQQHATALGEHNFLFGGLQSYFSGWTLSTRRLLRFASSIMNNGTADFRPLQHRSAWEWHACHMHWHSMNTFTHYDVVDQYGSRVAEGHKASFCLEDVECRPGARAKYSCRGFGEQGISVGCSDVYKQDIDCQWIDITDLKPGSYTFKLVVNPEYKVAELSYDNNAVTCEMSYTGYAVRLRDCALGRG